MTGLAVAFIAMTIGCKQTGASLNQDASQELDAQEQMAERNDQENAVMNEREEQQDADVQAVSSQDAPVVVSIADDGFLNIREMPVASSKIVGKLLTGGKGAEYLGSTGRWIRVRFDGVEGYVNGGFARIQGLEEQSLRVPGAKSRVYYVVIGSFENLDEAKKTVELLPDALDDVSIYRAKDKGKTVYRMSAGCYYKQAEAQRQVDGIKQYLDREAWVWTSDGVAPCVYQGIGVDGDPVQMGPK